MDRHAWDERYRAEEPVWGLEPSAFFVEAVSGLAVGTALDLACGQGRNAVWLATQGWDVTAVDWSEVGIDRGRALAESVGVSVDWRVADLLAWSPEGATYRLVVIVYLQIPQAEREEVWRSAAAAVAAEGRLVIIGHDSANLTDGYGGPQDPSVLYTAAEAAGVVGSVLRVLRSEQVLRRVETDDGVRRAVDNIVVARR